MKRLLPVALVVLAGYSNAAPPAAATGEWWSKRCADTRAPQYMECVSFVTGVVMGAEMQSRSIKSTLPFCVPQGVTFLDATGVFKAYLTEHPEKISYNSASLVMASLQRAYPCR